MLDSEKTGTEKVYEGNEQVHEILLKRFLEFHKENAEDASPATMSYLIKLAGSIGYSQQVHAGLVKSYQHESRIKLMEEMYKKIPPEVLQKYLQSKE